MPIKVTKTEKGTRVGLQLTMTRAEFDALVLMMGMATGAAFKNGMEKLAYSFIRLANKVNEDNPDWKPYKIPPEKR